VSSGPTLAAAVQAPSEIVAQRLPGPTGSKPDNAKAARQFEAMMMACMFKEMRNTVHPSGLLGDDGVARSTYEFLLDQAVTSRALQGGRGYGLAQRLEAAWDSRDVKKQGD
jgi:Rod binding domain-containing protein